MAARFPCPTCGALTRRAKVEHSLVKCTTGQRRIRFCPRCRRKLLTFQPYGGQEKFIRRLGVAGHYDRIEHSLKKSDVPQKYLDALAGAKARHGVG